MASGAPAQQLVAGPQYLWMNGEAGVSSGEQACTASREGGVHETCPLRRRIAWISFWGQLSLAIVSAVVVFFTMTASNWVGGPNLHSPCRQL